MSDEATNRAQVPFVFTWNRATVTDLLLVLGLPIACLALNPGIVELGSLGIVTAHWSGPGAYVLVSVLFLAYWISPGPSLSDSVRGMHLGAVILGVVMSGALAAALVPVALLSLPEALVALDLLLASGPFSPAGSGNAAAITAILPLLGLATSVTLGRYYVRYRALRREYHGRDGTWRLVPLGLAAPLALAVLATLIIETFLAGVA